MLDRPLLKRAQRLAQRASGMGEGVLDARRNLGIDGPSYETVPLEPPQRLGEHLLRDPLDASSELREASVALAEHPHDEDGPAVADPIEDAAGRAVRAIGAAEERRGLVLGGYTGYAGSAIVAEAATRGHRVTALSRTLPETPIAGVSYLQGDASDDTTLSAAIEGADVVVAALAPRGSLTATFREVTRTIARLADAAGAQLYVVGGFSSLRPAPGADRYVTDLSAVPAELHPEILAGAALIMEDLPAASPSLDWVFVSPALGFGAHAPGQRLGRYRLGNDVAVQPDGGAISAPDYALGFVDLIEKAEHHREQVNLGT